MKKLTLLIISCTMLTGMSSELTQRGQALPWVWHTMYDRKCKHMEKAIFAMIGLMVVVAQSATVYYVDASRNDDTGNGKNLVTAKRTIQTAIDISVAGNEIVVTNGVYNILPSYCPSLLNSSALKVASAIA